MIVRLQVMKTWGEKQQAEERLRALTESQFSDPQALALKQVSMEVVQSKTDLYNKANERADMLTVCAPVSGQSFPRHPNQIRKG